MAASGEPPTATVLTTELAASEITLTKPGVVGSEPKVPFPVTKTYPPPRYASACGPARPVTFAITVLVTSEITWTTSALLSATRISPSSGSYARLVIRGYGPGATVTFATMDKVASSMTYTTPLPSPSVLPTKVSPRPASYRIVSGSPPTVRDLTTSKLVSL